MTGYYRKRGKCSATVCFLIILSHYYANDRCKKLSLKLDGAQSAAAVRILFTSLWTLVNAWWGNWIFVIIYYTVDAICAFGLAFCGFSDFS